MTVAALVRSPADPVDGLTEVWASGVTYERSMDARVEESQVQDVYSRVYAADRPEPALRRQRRLDMAVAS